VVDYSGTSGTLKAIIQRKSLRFGVIEMGSYRDARIFSKCIKNCCLNDKGKEGIIEKGKATDVSPKIGRGKSFYNYNGGFWPEYKKAIEKPEYSNSKIVTEEPDWWYISGHHANHDWPDNKYYAKTYDVGFFNGPYHHYYHTSGVTPRKVKNAIFMTTSLENNSAFKATSTGKDLLDNQIRPNPLYKTGKNDKCKGLFLIGCNTLSFFSERLMFQKFFPNAIIFGYFESKAPGAPWKNVKAIFNSIKMSVPSFFEDPEAYIKNVGSLEDVVGNISKKTKGRRIAIYYKKTIYVPKYDWKKKRNWTTTDINNETDIDSTKENFVLCPVPGE